MQRGQLSTLFVTKQLLRYIRLLPSTPRFTATVLLLLTGLHPSDGIGVNLCPFRWHFGIPCPLCGLIRSMSAFMHGGFTAAWELHPLGPVVVAWLLAVLVIGRWDVVRQVAGDGHWKVGTAVRMAAWGAVFVCLWIVRLAVGLAV